MNNKVILNGIIKVVKSNNNNHNNDNNIHNMFIDNEGFCLTTLLNNRKNSKILVLLPKNLLLVKLQRIKP